MFLVQHCRQHSGDVAVVVVVDVVSTSPPAVVAPVSGISSTEILQSEVMQRIENY